MPSTARPSALPDGWIDRLFQRFSVLYGKHWNEMWADVPMADVKDAWDGELAGVTGEQIARALKQLGKFPPTLPEFSALCRPPAQPTAHRLFLPSPQIDQLARGAAPAYLAAEVEKLAQPQKDCKKWAKGILRDTEAGTYKVTIGIQMAKRALDLTA